MVMTSARGRGPAKKSPDATVTWSLSPAVAIAFSAIGLTTGRS